MHLGSVLSLRLYAIVIDVVTNEMKEGTLQEMFADGSVLIVENMAELQKKFVQLEKGT